MKSQQMTAGFGFVYWYIAEKNVILNENPKNIAYKLTTKSEKTFFQVLSRQW